MTNVSARPTALFLLTLGHAALLAQCPNPILSAPGGNSPCPSGSVMAMTKWDPDGPGPLGMHVVCGGQFGEAGAALTSNIALFDPVTRTWSTLGAGFDGPVHALTVLANGALVAAGAFQLSGATSVANVAQWNGSAWLPLGAGTDATVFALVVQPNGDLVAGGAFTSASGIPTNCVARWDGATWSALGGGVTGVPPFPVPSPIPTYVRGLGVRPNGDLLVTGEFALAGGVQANGVARWNGVAWSSLGFGPASVRVIASRVLANGDLVISTDDFVGNHAARQWNGATWTTLGVNSQMPWQAFGQLANGTLLAQRQDDFFTFSDLRAWNGISWVPYADSIRMGPANVLLEFAPNDLWMASSTWFNAAAIVRRWNGTVWQTPSPGLDGDVAVALAYRGGFVIGGDFSQVGSTPTIGLAMRSNGTWSALGGGIDGSAYALAELPGGDLLVGGTFSQAGSVAANNIARWNGAQWLAMGSFTSTVQSLAVGANGDVFAGSYYPPEVSRWNGSAWVTLGTLPLTFTPPYALVAMPNGDVVVGLGFGGGNSLMVLRWNGVAWSPLGSGLPGSGSGIDVVYSLVVMPNGDLVAGGRFAIGSTTSVARWDGTSWQPMGAGLPSTCLDLDLLPGGDLLATHWQFDDQGAPVVSPSRWNGVAWQAIPGLDAGLPHQSVSRAAVDDQGEVLLAGSFGRVQLVPSGGIASLFTVCPASSVSAGSGCVGSAGAVQLSVLANAWLGSTYRARTTGLPALAIAVQVFGLTSVSLPLASVLPSFPGCTLHVSPDVLLADLPTAGAVTAQWALPNSASLLGQSFRQQTVPFELAASGAITAVSASNAVQLTIGAW